MHSPGESPLMHRSVVVYPTKPFAIMTCIVQNIAHIHFDENIMIPATDLKDNYFDLEFAQLLPLSWDRKF